MSAKQKLLEHESVMSLEAARYVQARARYASDEHKLREASQRYMQAAHTKHLLTLAVKEERCARRMSNPS